MRLQLALPAALLAGAVGLAARPALVRAEDAVDATFTYFQERRPGTGDKTVLNVYHPQFDVGIDLGEHTAIAAGYEADVVSGATFALYAPIPPGEQVDVISGATLFDDLRHSGRAGIAFRGRRSTLRAGYSYGTERDYRSHSVSAGGSIDLPGKNSTFALSYSHNFDLMCDRNNGDATPLERQALSGLDECFTDALDLATGEARTITHDISIDTTEASLTQNLSPTMAVQLGVHGQVIDGFQSNPYRRVRVQGVDAQEHTPLIRARAALFARLHVAFPAAHSALAVDLRGYSDTWGVNSGTVEMAYNQYFGAALLLRARGRIYQQTGAVFFDDAIDYQNFGPAGGGEYFTGDRELAPLRDVLVGLKMSYLKVTQDDRPVWGVFDSLDFHMKVDAIYAQTLTTTKPGGDVTGVMPDQLVLQLGLLLRY